MRRYRAVFLSFFIFVFLSIAPNPMYAETEDLLPGKPVQSPSYSEYPRDYYLLDYAPPEKPKLLDKAYLSIISFLHFLLNLGWSLYLYVVELVIRLVHLGFDDVLFDQLFTFLGSMMPRIVISIWEPLWFIVAGIGIFTAICLWIMGHLNRSLMALVSMILLIAFVPIVMITIPSYMSQANQFVTALSGDLMGRMVYNHEKADLSKKPLQAITDTMWDTLVKKPYYIANFGSVAMGEKYADSLMKGGINKELRVEKIRSWGEMDEESGIASNKHFAIFTADGLLTRGYKLIVANLLALVPLYLLIGVALSILIWKAKAIGRAVFFVFDALMALYPGYGIQHAAKGMIQVFGAFLMVLFYSSALAIFFALWMKIMDSQAFPSSHFADQIFLILLLMIGMWTAVHEVRERLESGGASQMGGRKGGSLLSKAFMGTHLTRGAYRLITRNPLTRGATKVIARGAKRSARLTGKGVTKAGQQVGRYLSQVDAVGNLKSQVKAGLPLGRLKPLQPDQMKLTPNLSQEARHVFQDMKKKRMNPERKADMMEYLKRQPHQTTPMKELVQWVNKKPYHQIHETPTFDGNQIPIEPPHKNTPEYHVWNQVDTFKDQYKLWLMAKQRIRQERWIEYKQKKLEYDRRPIRQLFLKRPKWIEPTQREALQVYKRLQVDQEKKK